MKARRPSRRHADVVAESEPVGRLDILDVWQGGELKQRVHGYADGDNGADYALDDDTQVIEAGQRAVCL